MAVPSVPSTTESPGRDEPPLGSKAHYRVLFKTLHSHCTLRHPALKGEEGRKKLLGLPAPPPPPYTHSQWFILDGPVNHSIYFREHILHLASAPVSERGPARGCRSSPALHSLKLQPLCLWQTCDGVAGKRVQNCPWCGLRYLHAAGF